MAYNYICIDRGRALHVDLYLLLRDPNEYRVVVTGIVAHFPLNHFDTLDELQFVGKKFLVPHDVHKHLEYNYGSTYLTPEQDHKFDNHRTEIDNFEQIVYTYIIKVVRGVE